MGFIITILLDYLFFVIIWLGNLIDFKNNITGLIKFIFTFSYII